MAELDDIPNEFLRDEVREFVEREDERARLVGLYSRARPQLLVMGTVKGDLHDIGKNLCIMMLRGSGFEVVDLGVDTSPDDFMEAIEEHRPALVGMSALLTTTMPN